MNNMKYIYFIAFALAFASCKSTPPPVPVPAPTVEEPANIPMADSVVIHCGGISRKISTEVAIRLEIVKDDSGTFDPVKACNYLTSLRIEEMKRKKKQ